MKQNRFNFVDISHIYHTSCMLIDPYMCTMSIAVRSIPGSRRNGGKIIGARNHWSNGPVLKRLVLTKEKLFMQKLYLLKDISYHHHGYIYGFQDNIVCIDHCIRWFACRT